MQNVYEALKNTILMLKLSTGESVIAKVSSHFQSLWNWWFNLLMRPEKSLEFIAIELQDHKSANQFSIKIADKQLWEGSILGYAFTNIY